MFGVFKGPDQVVVAPTSYLSGFFCVPFCSFSCPLFLPLAVFCHAYLFVMSRRHGYCWRTIGGKSWWVSTAGPLFCVYFWRGATCGWCGFTKITGVLIEPGFHFALGFWPSLGISGLPWQTT